MAIDPLYKNYEDEEELLEEEFVVNPYTIQYDGRIKSFFKGFAPKVTGFGGIAAASAVGALAAVTGVAGVGGLVLAGVAGVSAITSGYFSVAYALDYTKCSKRALKNKTSQPGRFISQDSSIDRESKKVAENALGVIKFVKSNENEAYKYVAALEELQKQQEKHPEKKTIKIEGLDYSARELNRRIKGYTRLAYKGTKYLIKLAEEETKIVERYNGRVNLSAKEDGRKKARWYVLNQIGECVKDITSKRSEYNPYKGLIINSLHKGCLIGGNDYLNSQIRDIVAINDKNKTAELYFEMYEREMLERIAAELPKAPTREEILEGKIENLENRLDREQYLHRGATLRAWDLREQNIDLTQKLEEQTELTEKFEKRYVGSVKRGVKQRAEVQTRGRIIADLVAGFLATDSKNKKLTKQKKALQANINSLEAQVDQLEGQVDEAAHESAYWMDRAENAEQANVVFAEGMTEAQAKAQRTLRRLKTAGQRVEDLQSEKDSREKSSRLNAKANAAQMRRDRSEAQQRIEEISELLDIAVGDTINAEEKMNAVARTRDQFRIQGYKAEQELAGLTKAADEVLAEGAEAEKREQKLQQRVDKTRREVEGLEEKVLELLKANNANEDLVHNLGWDNYKLQKQLSEIKYGQEVDQEYISDLLSCKSELELMVERLEAEQTKKEINQYLMNYGRVLKNFDKKITQMKARALGTIKLNENNETIVAMCEDIIKLADSARDIDLSTKSLNDLQESYETFKNIYDAVGSGLVELPKNVKRKMSTAIRGFEVILEENINVNVSVQPK